VPKHLQNSILSLSKEFFSLPFEAKEKYDKDLGGFNRGYERLRAQNFEKRGEGDLKEGFYFGIDLPETHPYVVARKMNMGPNKYPLEVEDPAKFKETVDEYFGELERLAGRIFRVVMGTLGVNVAEEKWVEQFTGTPIAILRLLHYPPQEPDASALERGE
jgi:isopenicillin N synthase-like dioxygenase